MKELKYVGKRTPDIYGLSKLKGEAAFSDDLWLPNMLYGKMLRSPHPHARIVKINTSKALELDGVVSVMTGEDTPRIKFAAQISDMYPLAIGKVRYVGDPVAVVAAETEEIAWDALKLIEVEYEILPAVLNPEDAFKKDAPEIHEGKSNLLVQIKRDFGDAEKGFEESDYIFEDEFSTQALAHCNMEPRCSVARLTPEGVLQLWTGTQSPLFVRKEAANVCDLPLSKVRVMDILSGGGFGARSKFCEDEGVAALLAIHTGRPVKITFTREEEITTTRIRQPFKMKIKTGVKRDGIIPAREMHVVADKGAYCHYGLAVVGYAAGTAASMYKTPSFKYTGDVVYTNKQFGGPFRGFGAPQATFAIEVQMDEIAEKLEIDPLELRLKNGLKSGDTTASGWQITSCGFEECVRKAAESTDWNNKRKSGKEGRYRKGIGMASAVHVSGSNVFPDGEFSSIEIKMFLDGQVSIYKGSGDTGMWSSTVIAQMVAEELDIPMSRIRIISNDTEVVPQSLGSFASRVCFADGNAARKGAVQLRNYLLESASARLNVPVKDLVVEDGNIYSKKDNKNSISYGDAVFNSSRCIGHVLSSKYQYDPPTKRLTPDGYANVSAAYAFSIQVAEVVVDTMTGEVEVEKMTVAQDVGKAINPIAVEGQIEGAVVQGIGFALSEELITNEKGVIVSDCLEKYMMPTSMDIPDIEVILVETEDPEGPFGAKGVGEIGMNNTAAAIANAIYNAVGIRMHNLPMKAEDIYFAIKKEKKNA